MDEELKVGDSVTHPTFSVGEIVYGPYKGFATNVLRALVKFDDAFDRAYEVWVKDLKRSPKFVKGDRVQFSNNSEMAYEVFEIVDGPYVDPDGTSYYVVQEDDGEYEFFSQHSMKKINN